MKPVLFIDYETSILNAITRSHKIKNYSFDIITLSNPEVSFIQIFNND